jgi:AraC family transcriptional regulator
MFDVPPASYRKSCGISGAQELESSCTCAFRIEWMGPIHVVCLRHVGPYAEVGRAWQRLYAWAGQKNFLRGPARSMAICHDDPEVTPPDKVRCDCGLVINSSIATEGDFFQQEIPAREYAAVLHTGAYACLNDSYAELAGKWIPLAGREIANLPSIEFYLNTPENTPEEQLQTKIYLPLEK